MSHDSMSYDRALDDDIAQRVYSDPVARWFVTEAYRITDIAQLVAAAGEQLVASGIPLYRLLPEAELEPLGDHALKDIDRPQTVFGLKGAMS